MQTDQSSGNSSVLVVIYTSTYIPWATLKLEGRTCPKVA